MESIKEVSEKNSVETTFDSLPVEMVDHIISMLDADDLLSFRASYKVGSSLVSNLPKWRILYDELAPQGSRNRTNLEFFFLNDEPRKNPFSILTSYYHTDCNSAYHKKKPELFQTIFNNSYKYLTSNFSLLSDEGRWLKDNHHTYSSIINTIQCLIIDFGQFHRYFYPLTKRFDTRKLSNEQMLQLYLLTKKSRAIENLCNILVTISYLDIFTHKELLADISQQKMIPIWFKIKGRKALNLVNSYAPASPFYLIEWMINHWLPDEPYFSTSSMDTRTFRRITITLLTYPEDRLLEFLSHVPEFGRLMLENKRFVDKLSDIGLLKSLCMIYQNENDSIFELSTTIYERLTKLPSPGYSVSHLVNLQACIQHNEIKYTNPSADTLIPTFCPKLAKLFLTSSQLTARMTCESLLYLIKKLNTLEDIESVLNPTNGVIQSLVLDSPCLIELGRLIPSILFNNRYFVTSVLPEVFTALLASRPVMMINLLLHSPLIDELSIYLLKAAYVVNENSNYEDKENRAQSLRFYIRQQQYKMLPTMTPEDILLEAFDPLSSNNYINHLLNEPAIISCYDESELKQLSTHYPAKATDIQLYISAYQNNQQLILQGNVDAMQADIHRLMRRADITDDNVFSAHLSKMLTGLWMHIKNPKSGVIMHNMIFRESIESSPVLFLDYQIATKRFKFAIHMLIQHYQNQQFDKISHYANELSVNWRAVNGQLDVFERMDSPILPAPLFIRLLDVFCNETDSTVSALTDIRYAQYRSLMLLQGSFSPHHNNVCLRLPIDAHTQNDIASHLLSLPTTFEQFDSTGLKTILSHITRHESVIKLFRTTYFLSKLKSSIMLCTTVAGNEFLTEAFSAYILSEKIIPYMWFNTLLPYYPAIIVEKILKSAIHQSIDDMQAFYCAVKQIKSPSKIHCLTQLKNRMIKIANHDLPHVETSFIYTKAMLPNTSDVYVEYLELNSDQLTDLTLEQLSNLAKKYPCLNQLMAQSQKTILQLAWDENNRYVKPPVIYLAFIKEMKALHQGICKEDLESIRHTFHANDVLADDFLSPLIDALIDKSFAHEHIANLKQTLSLYMQLFNYLTALPASHETARLIIRRFCPPLNPFCHNDIPDLTELDTYIDNVQRRQNMLATGQLLFSSNTNNETLLDDAPHQGLLDDDRPSLC